VASTTGAQFALSAGAGLPQWTMRNAGGNLYFSTTSVAGTATTSTALLTLTNDGLVSIGSSTPMTGAKAPIFLMGTTSKTYIHVGTDGKMGIFGINNNSSRLSFGDGINTDVNPNVFGLFQDASDARFGASVNSSGIFMKSSGGVYGFNYTGGVPIPINFQEFGANVGVGSSTPWAKLSINPIAGDTGPMFTIGSSTKQVFLIQGTPTTTMLLGTTTRLDANTAATMSTGRTSTTTVNIGEIGLSGAKSCVNMMTNTSAVNSFYIRAGVIIVEQSPCK